MYITAFKDKVVNHSVIHVPAASHDAMQHAYLFLYIHMSFVRHLKNHGGLPLSKVGLQGHLLFPDVKSSTHWEVSSPCERVPT